MDAVGTGPGDRGVLLFAAHWSYLVADLAREVAPALAAGRPVILCTDGALPLAGHALAEAAAAAGFEPGALQVLHGIPFGEAIAALPAGLKRQVEVAGRLTHAAERAASLRALAATDAVQGELELPRAHGIRVGEHEDPVVAVERMLADLDPWPYLGAQRSGCVTHAVIHPRVFAAFSSALLEGLEGRDQRVPVFNRSLEQEFVSAVRHALGQGATLIHGLEDGQFRFEPVLVTNCEDHMGIVHDHSPRPLLRLSREVPGRA